MAWAASETRLKLFHAEICIITECGLSLGLNVLLDNLVRHIPRASGKVATSPKVLAPELATQFAKLSQHQATTAPLEPLHQITHGHMRGYGDQQVEMVSPDMSFLDIHIQRRTSLPDQLAKANSSLASLHWLTLLGNPDQVVLEVIHSVRSFPIIHDPILAWSSSFLNSS